MGARRSVIYDGLTPEQVALRLGSTSCVVLDRVASTQDVLHELAEDGAPAGTVVVADQQVRGRGRQGRTWWSLPGRCVLLSYLLRPEGSQAVTVVSLRVGIRVLEALREIGFDAMLKWPNDVMVADRKVAGILCEARWSNDQMEWLAVGIGINVIGPVDASLKDKAISLDEIRPDVHRVEVLSGLISRLHQVRGGSDLTTEESITLGKYDWLADRTVIRPVQGTVRGIASNGALQVQTRTGNVSVFGGEVVIA